MATKLMQARQQELKFLSHSKKSGLHAGGEEGETCTDQDEEGSIARSSLDLSQEFRVAHGCFSSALKRNFKAFCGRFGKWSMPHKKSSSLYKYLHINVPLDPHLSPLVFQKQKSKSKQSLLDHPIGLHDHSLIHAPHLSPFTFQKQKSKSKQSLLCHFIEHSHISEHEEIKDIHLDLQGTTFTSIDGTSLDLCEETKPQEQHPPDLYQEQLKRISGIDSLEKKHDPHLPLRANPSLIEGFEQQSQLVRASHDGSERHSEVLTGIHELMLGVTYGFGLDANSLISFNDHKSASSRSLQVKIPKPRVHSAKPKPILNLRGSDHLQSVNAQQKIIKSNYTHPKVHDVDSILASLATHVFSLRNQVIKGGFGGVHYPSLQGKEAISQHGRNCNNCYDNGDVYDVKKSMACLISSRKFEDLADLEEFLQCYMRLYSPCFLDMVNQFFREICNDIFESEGWFESKDPFIHS